MSYPSAPLSLGAVAYDGSGSPVPAMPSFTPGNLLVCLTASELGTQPTPPTPAGWLLGAASSGGQAVAWYAVATTGMSAPPIAWGSVPANAQIINLGGNFATPPTVHASNSKQNTSVNQIGYGSLGITVNGCAVIAFGIRDKTSASDSATFNTLTGFSLLQQYVHPSNFFCTVLNYQVQTTATSIAAQSQTWSIADSPAQPYESIIFALVPPTATLVTGSAADTTAATAALNTAIKLAASATNANVASAALTNFATVTLSATPYVGIGSVYDPNFWLDIAPVEGDTLYYDATYITIAPDGSISSTSNNCTALVQFNTGAGWALGLITFTPGLVAYADTAMSAVAVLSSGASLAGAATTFLTAAGSLSTQIKLKASALDAVTATAVLSGQPAFTAAASDLTRATGALQTAIILAADAFLATDAAATLNTGAVFQAAAIDQVAARAQLTTKIQLGATATNTTSATGRMLGNAASLAAGAQTSTAAAALLSTLIKLGAAASDVVTAYGALATEIQLVASAFDSSGAAGGLSTATLFAAAATDSTGATASVSTGIMLQGAAVDLLTASASLITQIQLIGNALDATSAAGNLDIELDADAITTTVATGDLTTQAQVSSETIWVLGA